MNPIEDRNILVLDLYELMNETLEGSESMEA